MAQTPATYRHDGDNLDYTPSSAVAAGEVVVIAGRVYVAPVAIAANKIGAVAAKGVIRFPKDDSVFAEGDAAYWIPTADPVGGTAGSGAMSVTESGGTFAGYVIPGGAQLTGAATVDVRLGPFAGSGGAGFVQTTTVAVGGTAIGNANAVSDGFTLVTGADDTAAVRLPEAAAGRVVIIRNSVANKILKVFPAVNDSINGAAANAVYNQTNGSYRTYTAFNAVAWYTDPEIIA